MAYRYINYRIVVEKEKSGTKWYSVQRRKWLFFWRYLDFHKESNTSGIKISFRTLEEADNHVQSDINIRYSESQKKIVSREYI